MSFNCQLWAVLLMVLSLTCMLRANEDSSKVDILIVYYSKDGNTEKMAEAVSEGAAEVTGVRVLLQKVSETTTADFAAADGIILGSPTYYANIAAPLKALIDQWYDDEVVLFDKVGGAFSTGGGRTAGRELVVTALLHAMLNNGMIIAGPHYEAWGTFGASAITAPPDEGVNADEENGARNLGRRIAELTLRLHAID